MHRLTQMQNLQKTGSSPGPTLQLGRNYCHLPATNTFLCLRAIEWAFTDHPDCWKEKNIWTKCCLKNSSPLWGNHYPPQGTSWVSPANGPRNITAVNETRNFQDTSIFWFYCMTLYYFHSILSWLSKVCLLSLLLCVCVCAQYYLCPIFYHLLGITGKETQQRLLTKVGPELSTGLKWVVKNRWF